MSDLIERLHATSETGVTPELIDEAIQRISELERDRDDWKALHQVTEAKLNEYIDKVKVLQSKYDALMVSTSLLTRPKKFG